MYSEGFENGSRRVRAPPPQGLEIGKTSPQIIINNPRSSIKPGSAPDPTFLIPPPKKPGVKLC